MVAKKKKRKYKPGGKITRDARKDSCLRQYMRTKNISTAEIRRSCNFAYSQPAISKFSGEPETMGTRARNVMATALKLPIDIIDDICNGKITDVIQILEAERQITPVSKENNHSGNQSVTKNK